MNSKENQILNHDNQEHQPSYTNRSSLWVHTSSSQDIWREKKQKIIGQTPARILK